MQSFAGWIERGPDGHAYYVKRKAHVPSIRHKITEAFREFRQRNQPLEGQGTNTSSSPQQPPAPAPTPTSQSTASTPKSRSSLKQRPRSHSEMVSRTNTPTQNVNPMQQSSAQPRQPLSHPAYPVFPPFMQLPLTGYNSHGNLPQTEQTTALVPHYATPHPRMYTYVPPGSEAIATQPAGVVPTILPATFAHGPNTSIQPFSNTHLTHTPNFGQAMTGLAPLPKQSLKHKCNVCGRLRSARYQRKHPISHGQLPDLTICRKCLKKASNSEDESTDSCEEPKYKSRYRKRPSSRGKVTRPRTVTRSLNRPIHRQVDFDFYATQKHESTSSGSESELESLCGIPSSRRRGRSRSTRDRSVEVVRYIYNHGAQRRPNNCRRKIFYVEDHSDQGSVSNEDEVEVYYMDHAPR